MSISKLPRATLEQKVQILDYHHRSARPQSETVNRYKDEVSISTSSFSEWLKNEAELRERLRQAKTSFSKSSRRKVKFKYEKINNAMDLLVKQRLERNEPINEPLLREHWSIYAHQFGVEDPKRLVGFSHGWLSQFKKRHGLNKTNMGGASPNSKEEGEEKATSSVSSATSSLTCTPVIGGVYNNMNRNMSSNNVNSNNSNSMNSSMNTSNMNAATMNASNMNSSMNPDMNTTNNMHENNSINGVDNMDNTSINNPGIESNSNIIANMPMSSIPMENIENSYFKQKRSTSDNFESEPSTDNSVSDDFSNTTSTTNTSNFDMMNQKKRREVSNQFHPEQSLNFSSDTPTISNMVMYQQMRNSSKGDSQNQNSAQNRQGQNQHQGHQIQHQSHQNQHQAHQNQHINHQNHQNHQSHQNQSHQIQSQHHQNHQSRQHSQSQDYRPIQSLQPPQPIQRPQPHQSLRRSPLYEQEMRGHYAKQQHERQYPASSMNESLAPLNPINSEESVQDSAINASDIERFIYIFADKFFRDNQYQYPQTMKVFEEFKNSFFNEMVINVRSKKTQPLRIESIIQDRQPREREERVDENSALDTARMDSRVDSGMEESPLLEQRMDRRTEQRIDQRGELSDPRMHYPRLKDPRFSRPEPRAQEAVAQEREKHRLPLSSAHPIQQSRQLVDERLPQIQKHVNPSQQPLSVIDDFFMRSSADSRNDLSSAMHLNQRPNDNLFNLRYQRHGNNMGQLPNKRYKVDI